MSKITLYYSAIVQYYVCSAVQYSVLQLSLMQYSEVQCSILQYGAVQLCKARGCKASRLTLRPVVRGAVQ